MGGKKANDESLDAESQHVENLLTQFTKKNPPVESEVAIIRLSEFTLNGVFAGVIEVEGDTAVKKRMSEAEFKKLLRQSSGALTDPRAYLVASLGLSNNQADNVLDKNIDADDWEIAIDGDQATATSEYARAGNAKEQHKIDLRRIDGEWRISKLNLKLTNWPGVVVDEPATKNKRDSEDEG